MKYTMLLVSLLWFACYVAARGDNEAQQIGPIKASATEATNGLYHVHLLWKDTPGLKFMRCELLVQRDGQTTLRTGLSCPLGKGDFYHAGLFVSEEQARETSVQITFRKSDTKEDQQHTVNLFRILPGQSTNDTPQPAPGHVR